MYCVKQLTEDLYWVGGNDRRLALFEGVYAVPKGVSYNAYLLLDEKTVLFDTVDRAVSGVFFENIEHVLNGRPLDYLVVHHMEPDHSATMQALSARYPEMKIICNSKIAAMIRQFFTFDIDARAVLVKEGESFSTGRHQLNFVMAPMVHWPEVMASYDSTDGILFSADAFGCFGALNGAIWADEVDFERDYLDEARRYYTNIVGKYGTQVQALLKKAAGLDIRLLCPLHGFVWRRNIGDFVARYAAWSSYTPERQGVVIAYASVYGNTENAAEILSARLRDRGIPTVMFDVSVTAASEIIAAAFEYSHLVFASTTYNAGIFVNMEALLHDLTAHNIQNRTVALIENGSWAPTSGGLMRKLLAGCKNMTILEEGLTLRSSLKETQLPQLEALADAIAASFPQREMPAAAEPIANEALFRMSYGLYVLTSRENGADNGCVINTATQVTDQPKQIAIAVNKANLTHDQILRTGEFNLSVLDISAPFELIRRFGFQSGRNADKFEGIEEQRTSNGLRCLPSHTNAVLSARVVETRDCGTHTLFIAVLTEAQMRPGEASMTYQYYLDHVKPRPQPLEEQKTGWVCKVCGYVYEGETLPADYVCPLCKHGPEAFERL